jgi:hypothetical protein
MRQKGKIKMWVFATRGFISVVEDKNNSDNLMVRGRFRRDLQKLFPRAKISFTPDADYRYRISLPRRTVADAVFALIMRIDYHNFKETVDTSRSALYGNVWGILKRAQDANHRDPYRTQEVLFPR